ncbi:MAG: MraY family glycosyltransferase [Cyclobacteriaceae bacterium]
MEKIVLSTATSYFIALILVPVAIKVLKSINVMDNPDDERKLHKQETPSMGGIAIFLAVFMALPIWLPISVLGGSKYLLAACFLMFLLGMRDDFIMLRARHKLIGQLVIGMIVIYFADIRFESLYGILGIETLPYWASVAISLFTFVVITNAYNLIDGIDGLAGSIGILVLGFLGFWFFQTGEQVISMVCLSTVGAIFAFLYFNWQPAKIFMGDTGSLFIGFLIAIFTVKFINSNYFLPASSDIKYISHITMAVGLLSIPLFDTLRVFIVRIVQGNSPMVPDRNHLHHRLLQMGLSHKKSTLVLLGANVFLTILAVLLQDLGNLYSFAILLTTVGILNFTLFKVYKFRTSLRATRARKAARQVYLSKSA